VKGIVINATFAIIIVDMASQKSLEVLLKNMLVSSTP